MFSETQEFKNQQTPFMSEAISEAPDITLSGQEVEAKGTVFVGKKLTVATNKRTYFGPNIKEIQFHQEVTNDSPFSLSRMGTKGGQEVMQPCRFMVNQIIRSMNNSPMLFESVIWDQNRTQVIGNFVEMAYQLKHWQTSWAIREQLIPDEALVVVALGIAIATQGTGGALFNSIVTGMTNGAMVASGTGMVMASAGFTSLATQWGTSFLRDADPLKATSSLFTPQSLQSLGTSLITAGLIGHYLNIPQDFSQRLIVNGLKSVVRASVTSVIEGRISKEIIKDAAMSTLIDSISGAIAEKIGQAAIAKINPLSPFTHKLAHFALGFGVGAALDSENVLTSGLTSGAGAVIAETVAETLVDRQQIQREVLQEMKRDGHVYDDDIYRAAYRAKLQPYAYIGRLVAGSVIAAMGHNPTLAIAAATNALENNFMGPVPSPELKAIPPEICDASWQMTMAAKEAFIDLLQDMKNNPDAYVEDAVVNSIPYGDISKRLYLGEDVRHLDYAIETAITLLGCNTIKGLGHKAASKFTSSFTKKMEKLTFDKSSPLAIYELDFTKASVGEYRYVRGHHVHAKKAFEGHINYDPKKGFSISSDLMKHLGIDHAKVISSQRKLFNELVDSCSPNTMKEHSRIAVEALIEGGCKSRAIARKIVADSLKNLKNSGVRVPTTIPWNKK